MKVLLLDKGINETDALAGALSAEGFSVDLADVPGEGRAPDLVLFTARDADGLVDEIGRLRAKRPDAFVMVVMDGDRLSDRLECYQAGADDCLSRPFHVEELAAKLRAFGRRGARRDVFALLPSGNALVDCSALELRVEERVRSLTRREAELLALLAQAGGEPVRREEVLRNAWDAPAWMTNNSVDVYVGYARRKLELLLADVTIVTVRGVGFQVAKLKAKPGR